MKGRREEEGEEGGRQRGQQLIALLCPSPSPPLITTNTFAPGLLSRQTELLEKGSHFSNKKYSQGMGRKIH